MTCRNTIHLLLSCWLPALLLSLTVSTTARADTVASLLGNFTVNQFCGLHLGRDQVKLHYVVVFGQLPALRELHRADTNGDGVTTQTERDAYVRKLAPGLADQLRLRVNGQPVALQLKHWTSSLPNEAAGFSLRLDADFVGTLAQPVATTAQRLQFDNRTYSGRIGWHEIRVQADDALAVFATNAYSSSLTDGLSANPKTLPPGGPLDERSVHLSFLHGAVPAGATSLAARSTTPDTPSTNTADNSAGRVTGAGAVGGGGVMATLGLGNTWLARQTKRLVDSISGPDVPAHILMLALLAALVLGALHAFSPGHGKTVVGAYLIGSRGTPKHAAFLGLTVTITHTLGVFLLGFATLFASQFIVPERLFPILSLISGLLVVVIGMVLLIQRLRGMGGDGHAHHQHGHHHDHPHNHNREHRHDHAHSDGHHHHHHQHDHDDTGAKLAGARFTALESPSLLASTPRTVHGDHHHHHGQDGLTHSHGGTVHTHLPPGAQGERITWSSLLALGISGGLIPCPSAMVLLLAAVALHKTAYGLILVLVFSVGLAITLTCVGLAFLYARRLFPHASDDSIWARILPIGSAAVITLVGLLLCYSAVISSGLGVSA